MLKIFRKNQFLRSVLLLPIALLLNLNLVLLEPIDLPAYAPYIDSYLSTFRTSYPVLHWLVYAVVLFIGAALMNRMIIINRLSSTITLFPGLFFIVIMSTFPVFGGLTSVSISLILFILMLSNLMYVNTRGGAPNKLFNVGLYLGIMILLLFPLIIFLTFVIVAVSIVASLKRKVIFNLINGLLLPAYFVLIYWLVSAQSLNELSTVYLGQFGIQNFSFPDGAQLFISGIAFAFYILVILFTYNTVISKKNIQSIRKTHLIALTVLFALVTHFLLNFNSMHSLVFIVPAVSFYISEAVLRMKKETNGELVAILMIMLCLCLPFIDY